MPKTKHRATLTQAHVQRLKPKAQRYTVWDSMPGFGIRVTPEGRKCWVVCFGVED
jgi:hypothetical protein